MIIKVDNEFRKICETIVAENKTNEEWSDIESCDMFQSDHYCGGYESIEKEFCFSYYDENNKEYWFQLSLNEIHRITRGKIKEMTNLVERKSKDI